MNTGKQPRTQEKYNQHTKDLEHKPAVVRNGCEIFQQLALRALDIVDHLHHIVIDALYSLALLRHHVGELAKYLTELRDGGLDRFDSHRALLHIARLLLFFCDQLLLLLHAATHHIERKESVATSGSCAHLFVRLDAGGGRTVVQHRGRRRCARWTSRACKRIQWRCRACVSTRLTALERPRSRAVEELFRAVTRCLHVLGAHLEDLLEARCSIREVRLQHCDHVATVLAGGVLARAAALRVERQLGQLAVQTRNIVFDNVRELRDFHGPVIKKRFASCDRLARTYAATDATASQ